MTVENNLSEIRAALATLSAVHAQGQMTRADMLAAVNFVEARCDEIDRLTAPVGMLTLPLLTLKDVAAEGRAAAQTVGRRHLRAVPSEGGVA